jgi:hypothetical protein
VFAAGVSPVGLTSAWRLTRRTQAALASTGGVLWSTRPVPTTRAGRLNFVATLEGSVRVAAGASSAVALSYRHHHLSNASTASENPAVASHLLAVGLVVPIRPRGRARA